MSIGKHKTMMERSQGTPEAHGLELFPPQILRTMLKHEVNVVVSVSEIEQ
jgi:hypothetical protein